MTHLPNYEKDNVQKLFEELGKDDYGYLWHVVGDFEINGHHVNVTGTTLFGHIVIDNGYVRVRDGATIIEGDKRYTPIEYAMHKLGF